MIGFDLGVLIGDLQDHYQTWEIEDHVIDVWWENFQDVPLDRMRRAARAYMEGEDDPPTVARFREYLSAVGSADRAAAGPDWCAHCEGVGWRESRHRETAVASRPTEGRNGKMDGPPETYEFTYPPGYYPCEHCNTAGYERWQETFIPEARRMRPVKSTTTFPFNPQDMLSAARLQLDSVGTLTKDPGTL